NASGDVNSGGTAFFSVVNNLGIIGSGASVDVNAASLTATNFVEAFIDNTGGTIGNDATIQIGTTGNLNAGNLFAVIFNRSGGSIGGDADIAMNVGGTATVTNDATIQIVGNDPRGTASIEFNGGTYQVGGTFFNTIDGNGTITFNNTNIHANVVQAGVFGANGTLMIAGGSLSANQVLKLYAPGSSGTIDFTANVTLTCKAAALILAANTITINDNVVVTIGGGFQASVYANIVNYTGSGGNGSTTGTFVGAGATTNPLSGAPSFNDPPASATLSTTRTAIVSTKVQSSSTTNVGSSGNVTAATGSTHEPKSQRDVSMLAARRLASAKTTSTQSMSVTQPSYFHYWMGLLPVRTERSPFRFPNEAYLQAILVGSIPVIRREQLGTQRTHGSCV